MRELVDGGEAMSLRDQCELLGISRSGYYYESRPESPENLAIMRRLDELHLANPVFGSRRLEILLEREGLLVNRKRVMRLLQVMGIEAIYPKARTSDPGAGHRIYPYLLKGLEISGPDQVWCSDITYVPLQCGYLYLVVVMDWHSRHVLAWRLSNTLESTFCLEALDEALARGRPEIFNTDQGSQFTSDAFTSRLIGDRIAISMDGKGRATDNVFIERLWRSVKYEDIYLKDYVNGADVNQGLTQWFDLYTHRRPHQGLGGRTPFEVYHQLPVT